MEGYSQQGFRPGRLVMIIHAVRFASDIGKVAELVASCEQGQVMEYEGKRYHATGNCGRAWLIKSLDEEGLLVNAVDGEPFRDKYGFRPEFTLMLIDDPDKELDTMEERLNNAHPLLLTHKQEEKV